MNIRSGLPAVKSIIKESIFLENTREGLLSDVNTIITVANNETGVNEPAIWINQHPTTVANDKVSLSNDLKLNTIFEFVCIEYDPNPEIAELKGQDLATRVVQSIQKNWRGVQKEYGERVITNIEFYMFYPVGEVTIRGKREKVPATSVALNIVHYISWLNCCRKKENTENIDENNEDNGD